ncbi:MAG: methyltransferase domain-containing protein [Candidatus Micrarchaeota archaeon]
MRWGLLKLLECIKCRSSLSLRTLEEDGDEIVEGALECKKCGEKYPIIRAVPRMLPPHFMAELVYPKYPEFFSKHRKHFPLANSSAIVGFENNAKAKTSKSFGYEWKKFPHFHRIYKRQFIDWLSPNKPSMFEGKLVLDAGCGMGRHLAVASDYAREIVGIDLSEAVDASYGNLRSRKNVHLVQADIYNLPFGRPFDLAYSIGVLHHLPNPQAGFKSILTHIRRGGQIFVWVYGHEGNFVMVNIIEPFRKLFTSRLPHGALYLLCHPVTIALELSCLLYQLLNAIPLVNIAAKYLPSNTYLLYIANFSFRHKLAIVFDFLSAPLARYYRKAEFAKWFANAKLKAKLYPHNGNSWKALSQVN